MGDEDVGNTALCLIDGQLSVLVFSAHHINCLHDIEIW